LIKSSTKYKSGFAFILATTFTRQNVVILSHIFLLQNLYISNKYVYVHGSHFHRYTNVALTLQINSKFHDYKLWLSKCLIIILTIVTKLCSTISTMYEYTSTEMSMIHIYMHQDESTICITITFMLIPTS
jgi:hypothetical protein